MQEEISKTCLCIIFPIFFVCFFVKCCKFRRKENGKLYNITNRKVIFLKQNIKGYLGGNQTLSFQPAIRRTPNYTKRGSKKLAGFFILLCTWTERWQMVMFAVIVLLSRVFNALVCLSHCLDFILYSSLG